MLTMEDVERRLVALETAQMTNAATMKWMVGTLGQIQATVDNHTERLDDHTQRLERLQSTVDDHTKRHDDHTKRLDRIEGEVRGLRTDVRGLVTSMPEIVASALRDVLQKD
jgi:uncharacterized coiled-coil protein SlyX